MKCLLNKHIHPPELQETEVKMVLAQAARLCALFCVLCAEWE